MAEPPTWGDRVVSGIIGRDAESGEIARFLERAQVGPACLVLAGEAGIGKTTLWNAAIERATAASLLVLRCRPSESESSLSFAALHDLLAGVADLQEDLPDPQRRALAVALLEADPEGPPPDQLAVCVAASTLIGSLTGRGSVLVAIDDAQWVDRPTARVLEFAVRRLSGLPVGLLVSTRSEAAAAPFGLHRAFGEDLYLLRVGPLNLSELFRLLRDRTGEVFSRPVLTRIEATSGGNPFFALELARALLRSGVRPGPADDLPVPTSLSALVDERLRTLPQITLDVLSIAAMATDPGIEVVGRAAELDTAALAAALAPARAVGVARIEGRRVVFDHPLLAAGVVSRVDEARRMATHGRLALVVSSPEARARHLAQATSHPDASVAGTLEDSASGALARGAPDTAAELFGLAVSATPPEDRDADHRRRGELAMTLFLTGDLDTAGALLEALVGATPAGPERANVLLRLAKIRFEQRSSAEAIKACDRAIEDARGDRRLLTQAHTQAAHASDFDMEQRAAHARAAMDLVSADPDVDPSSLAQVLTALTLAELCLGNGLRRDLIDRAIELEVDRPPVIVSTRASTNLGGWLVRCDDLSAARPLLEDSLAAAHDADEGSLCEVLMGIAELELASGRWVRAEDALVECFEVAERDGQPVKVVETLAILAPLQAATGCFDEASRNANRILDLAATLGDPVPQLHADDAAGRAAFHRGDLHTAVAHLGAADRVDEREHLLEPGFRRYLGDLVESLIGTDRIGEAGEALGRLREMAEAVDRPSALATASRCRAMLDAEAGDLDAALAACAEARRHHERLKDPFELARTRLIEGRIRRRRKEKLAAREAFDDALSVFEQLGAVPWVDRARLESRRTGERTRSPAELTVTERRVAELAATGLTNREVAAALFMSPRSVEANLTKVYRKLEVPSRAALGLKLAEIDGA